MALESLAGGASANAALRTAQLSNQQTEAEGQAALQLLESAAEPQQASPSSANLAVGANVDTFA